MSISRRSKGQSGVEFMAMMALSLLLFTAFFSFFVTQQNAAFDVRQHRIAANMADRIGFQLDIALIQGDGFERRFRMPETIKGAAYTVSILNGTVIVEYEGSDVLAPTAARDVTGTVTNGTNLVRNQGGLINVTQP